MVYLVNTHNLHDLIPVPGFRYNACATLDVRIPVAVDKLYNDELLTREITMARDVHVRSRKYFSASNAMPDSIARVPK